jgi:hypothetical protein
MTEPHVTHDYQDKQQRWLLFKGIDPNSCYDELDHDKIEILMSCCSGQEDCSSGSGDSVIEWFAEEQARQVWQQLLNPTLKIYSRTGNFQVQGRSRRSNNQTQTQTHSHMEHSSPWTMCINEHQNLPLLRFTHVSTTEVKNLACLTSLALWIHYKSDPIDLSTVDITKVASTWQGQELQDYLTIKTSHGFTMIDYLEQWTDLHRQETLCTSVDKTNVSKIIHFLDRYGSGLVSAFEMPHGFWDRYRNHEALFNAQNTITTTTTTTTATETDEIIGHHGMVMIGYRQDNNTGQVFFLCQNSLLAHPWIELSSQDMENSQAKIYFTWKKITLKSHIPTVCGPLVSTSADVPEGRLRVEE